jgi:excisionase family DNA binding protein
MSLRLLTVTDVSDRLGLTEYQVRAEHARGLLPGRRVGRLLRFTEADLDAYLERIREDRGADASGLTRASRNRRRTA